MGKTKGEGSQSAPSGITPLLEPLMALQRLLEHFDNQGVIIGGIAASLLGKPRFTADLDAVILLRVDDLPIYPNWLMQLVNKVLCRVLLMQRDLPEKTGFCYYSTITVVLILTFRWAFCLLRLRWSSAAKN
jgi:hypothetical protein